MGNEKRWDTPPEMTIDPSKTYRATIRTNRGPVTLDLYPEHAPKTVNNFVFLARQGYYDGVSFHRVIEDFVVQGGDPTGSGMGGPGYSFEDETDGNPLIHETGVISMANAGPNTNGSQFFIVVDNLVGRLPKNYTIFGQVTKGMDVVDRIVAAPRNSRDLPDEPVAMTGVTIHED